MDARQQILNGTAPDGLTVGGGLDLRGTQIEFPCVASQRGKPGMALACCPIDGYTLVAHDDGSYSAGCQDFKDAKSALQHWDRPDGRAVLFTKKINEFESHRIKGES